ncbi:MAG: hypothetical protein R3C20_19125 [Planctomycetaceae bacterium]
MTTSLGSIMAESLNLSLNYAERMLKDITPSMFARIATPGGVAVDSNHAAFIYGHLSLYGPRILEQLDLPAPLIPDGFDVVFSKDAKCVDDPDATIYPSMEVITTAFFNGHRAVEQVLRTTPDEVFSVQNPQEGRMRELFPTLGSMHNFYLGGHMMIHLGQLSAWRRMMGLGPA